MEFGNMNLQRACEKIVFEKLNPDDGGVIAVDSKGNITMIYNAEGMFRGSLTSESDELHVKIWE